MRLLLISCSFLLTSCNHLFYYPQKEILFPPERINLKYESVSFPSQDGTMLTAWFFPAKIKTIKGTIVQFHGNAENMTSHYLSQVWLVNEGYNFFTFDYRGYGKSDGTPTQQGTVMDGAAALKKAWEKHLETTRSQKKTKFIVWGQSLGGAILQASIANFPELKKVDLMILDSTFNSYRRVAFTVMKNNTILFLFSPLAWVLISDRYSGRDYMMKNQIPILIIHDEKDPAVPFANGEDIFHIDHGPKEFWRLNQGGHVRAFAPDQEVMKKQLVQYLSM